MRGGQMAVAVLDQMQMFDQQIAPARPVGEQRAHLVERRRVDLAALGRARRPAAAAGLWLLLDRIHQATFTLMCPNMAFLASSSNSVLNLCLSLSAFARAAAGRAEISSTSRFRFGKLGPVFRAERVRNEPRPAPHRHVDDGVGVAEHVFLLGQARVENGVMALRLVHVAIDGVFDFFRRVIAEMHRLAGERPDAGGDEHQPRQQFAARLVAVGRQEFSGLLGEIKQDRVRVEHGGVAVDDRRHLGVRIDRQIFRLVLLAFAGVDRDRLVGQPGFLEHERDLHRIGRAAIVEFDHRSSSVCEFIRTARRSCRRRRRRSNRPPALSAGRAWS